jgi:LSD1 subclass zinc finger protein
MDSTKGVGPQGGFMAGQDAAGVMGVQSLQKVKYVCGECGKLNELLPGSTAEIKCKSCSGRIFYKVRERQALQYEAR